MAKKEDSECISVVKNAIMHKTPDRGFDAEKTKQF
jgi:hypothetical protein